MLVGARSQPAPAKVPAPRPPGAAPSGLGGMSVSTTRGVNAAPPVFKSPGGDIQSSGSGYGSAQANAFKQSPAYRQAVVDTYLHQSQAQQHAIVQGALKTPTFEGHTILSYLKGAGGLSGTGVAKSGAMQGSSGLLGTILPFGSQLAGGVEKAVGNAGKDLVNLPAEAVTTVSTLGGDVLSGNVGKLGHDLISPYEQLIKDPVGTFLQHPLNTALMVAGPVHGATRVASAGVRAVAPESAVARALGPEVPPSVRLTGNLTHERPALSPYPLIKAGQKGVQALRYKTSPTGDLVPRSENVRAMLLKRETSRSLVGTRERIRRAGVQAQVVAHAKSVVAPLAGKIAHSAKTALKYDPGSALIHGANLLALVADHTIRTPESFLADLQKHISDVAATRPELIGMPKALAEHDQYVKTLTTALNDKALRNPANVQRLFDAAHKYATDIKPLQNEAFAHGHYGDLTKEALLRRELQPVVLSHVEGARLDPNLGMVKDIPQKGGGVLSRALTTGEMQAFDRMQTGGRPLAYTSHAVPKGDSAFYKNQQAYPARAIERNTGYAFTHGLRDPTHEALLSHRVELENVINAHRSMDKILSSTALKGSDLGLSHTGYWGSFKDAQRDAPPGYVPIQVGRMTVKGEGAAPTVDNLGHEAAVRSLDLNERLRTTSEPGKFGLIDHNVTAQLKAHANQISPNTFLRAARGTTSQFRRVALGTSVRHIPGVIQEGVIRDIGAGLFVQHLLSAKNVFKELANLDPRTAAEKAAGVTQEHAAGRLARERQTELAGGMVAGMTRAMATRQGAGHFEGTVLHPVMKAYDAFLKSPGPRQLTTAWQAWTHVVIDGTKKALESNQQSAALGKAMQRQVGKLMMLQGKAAREAARGLLSDQTARQLRAEVQRTMGTWTDLTPSGQMAMMFSPFGMWWVNSVKWLARMPVDQPVKTGLLASATTGTEKQRQAEGLDMFSPNALAGYLQGSIPVGNRLVGAQYYSPFGVAGDPAGTAASLMEPTLTPAILALLGDNYLGRTLRSPGDPYGHKIPNQGTRALVALNSVLANFVPLYTKAETVAQGGASAYDTSTLFNTQTKTPSGGLFKGLEKALSPLREYKNPKAGAAAGGAASSVGIGAPVGNGQSVGTGTSVGIGSPVPGG